VPEELTGRDESEDLAVDGRIMFGEITCDGVEWILVAQDPVASTCKHGNRLSDSMKGRKFIDQLRYYKLLKKDSALCGWSFVGLVCSQRNRKSFPNNFIEMN
jgi:hypothetical protein